MKIQVKSTFIERSNWLPNESGGTSLTKYSGYLKAKGGKNVNPMDEFVEGFKAYSYDYPNFNVKLAYLKEENPKGERFEIRLYPKDDLANRHLTDEEWELINGR